MGDISDFGKSRYSGAVPDGVEEAFVQWRGFPMHPASGVDRRELAAFTAGWQAHAQQDPSPPVEGEGR